mmetsp:Transcript_13364/g.22736  ORF Transcript_13364/g.22736 Transcript_13364/m.22736 type:complete len:123 (+) Transcript_13364:3915-4283(+)
MQSRAYGCERAVHHLTQCQQVQEVEDQLGVFRKLLANESNEKFKEFASKNRVLMAYQMIDEEENILFKGKVARCTTHNNVILCTQLFFSGYFKLLDDRELLAIFAVLDDDRKPGGGAPMLQS